MKSKLILLSKTASLFRSQFGMQYGALYQYHQSCTNMKKSKSKQSADGKKGAKCPEQNTPQPEPSSSIMEVDRNGNIRLSILVKPNAKQTIVTDITSEGVGLQVAAPPSEGEANTELVRFLAKLLGIRKSDVSVDKGQKSRKKTILISKDRITVDEITTVLKQQL